MGKGLKVENCVLAERGKTQGDVKRPNMNGLSQQMMEIPNFKKKKAVSSVENGKGISDGNGSVSK